MITKTPLKLLVITRISTNIPNVVKVDRVYAAIRYAKIYRYRNYFNNEFVGFREHENEYSADIKFEILLISKIRSLILKSNCIETWNKSLGQFLAND